MLASRASAATHELKGHCQKSMPAQQQDPLRHRDICFSEAAALPVTGLVVLDLLLPSPRLGHGLSSSRWKGAWPRRRSFLAPSEAPTLRLDGSRELSMNRRRKRCLGRTDGGENK
nr:unnamed protein product [Digitaria exilis]